MEMDSFTDRSRGFIQAAQTTAVGRGHQRFSPLHLLQALLADGEGVASRLVAPPAATLSASRRPSRPISASCRRSPGTPPASFT